MLYRPGKKEPIMVERIREVKVFSTERGGWVDVRILSPNLGRRLGELLESILKDSEEDFDSLGFPKESTPIKKGGKRL